jgi:4'-phosphopantetheinyl transferase EntD
VVRAVPRRRAEFALGRHCARTALARLGASDGPLLSGSRREPLWPEGFRGSITHCDGYGAAAVARARDVASVGIDAELHGPLPEGVLALVADADERGWIAGRTGDGVSWDKVLFSAKESVYKAWFPLTGRWLGFEEAHLTFDPEAGTFRADVLVPAERARFDGRFAVGGGLVFTAATVSATGP